MTSIKQMVALGVETYSINKSYVGFWSIVEKQNNICIVNVGRSLNYKIATVTTWYI